KKGQMAFEYVDAETGDIIDILERRDARAIKEHFIRNYHLKDLKKVETITIDMNAGYVNVIKEIFSQAKIIRSEERRVGKECRYRWWADHESKKRQGWRGKE